MADFPDTYPIATLRGRSIPSPHDVRRALKKRVAWLEWKIADCALEDRPIFFFKAELKGLALAIEAFDREHPVEVVVPAAEGSQ